MEQKPKERETEAKVTYFEGPESNRIRAIRGRLLPDDGDFIVVVRSDGVTFRISKKFVVMVVEVATTEPEVL